MVKRQENENYTDYFIRLAENKDSYELSWEAIAELLNFENGMKYSEGYYRRHWNGFNEGREYERKKSDFGIATRILSCSDFHYPFNLPINIFEDYVGRVDILQLNGDIVDMQQISSFTKSYRVSPMEEMIGGRQYLIDLIEYIKPRRVIATTGNHEYRYGVYLSKNLDTDLKDLLPETALDSIFDDGFRHYNKESRCKTWYDPLCNVFNNIDILYVGTWHCQIGNTIFCHPKAYSSAPMKTAEKALAWFRNEGYMFDSLVMAHTHRLGEYKIGNTVIYEQGACCDTTKVDYNDGQLVNSQQKGFIYLCQDKDGNLIKDKTKLISN